MSEKKEKEVVDRHVVDLERDRKASSKEVAGLKKSSSVELGRHRKSVNSRVTHHENVDQCSRVEATNVLWRK